MKLGPRPTGRPWTPAEDEQLLALLDSRMDQHLIAHRLKRTVHAVLSRKYVLNKRRLVEMGLKVKGMSKLNVPALQRWKPPPAPVTARTTRREGD